jgi:hypothetical protein
MPGQHESRQDEVLYTPSAIRGQPAQDGPEKQYEHDGDPEAGCCDANNGEELADLVEYRVPLDSG